MLMLIVWCPYLLDIFRKLYQIAPINFNILHCTDNAIFTMTFFAWRNKAGSIGTKEGKFNSNIDQFIQVHVRLVHDLKIGLVAKG